MSFLPSGPSLGTGKKQVLTEDLSAELSIKETRKSCFFFFFFSKCHHIHLLLQALGRKEGKPPGSRLSNSSHHCFPLYRVLKGLRLHRMVEHLVSQSVLGSVLHGTLLRDTDHGFYLDFWVAKCRVEGKSYCLQLLWIGLEELDSEAGTHPSTEI